MSAAPPRPSMSKARRARIWERDGGVCYLCGLKVAAGVDWEAEHVIPWALSFDDSDQNLKVAHKDGDCHAAKTKVDVKRIAKAKAQAGETGQRARRERRQAAEAERGVTHKPKAKIAARGFEKGPKRKWPKRPFR